MSTAASVPAAPAAACLSEVRNAGHEFTLPNGTPLCVLEDINLAIGGTEWVALLGPSGCGKSTILPILDALTAESLRAEVIDIWQAKSRNISSILMVSHDIKEVVYMADRIVILDAKPGRVRTIVKNELPRPRDYRSPQVLTLVDQLHDII